MIDEPDSDYVTKSSGIILSTASTTRGAFRVGKVLKCGPSCVDVKQDDFVIIPPNVGMVGHKTENGYKTLFVREESIMAIVSFDGTKEEFLQHVKENLHSTI